MGIFVGAGKLVLKTLTENLGLKFIALIITALLYMLVRFQEEGERIVDVEVVPPEAKHESGLVVTTPPPASVRLRLRGAKSRLNALQVGDIPPLQVDLKNRREGTTYYYFSAELFDIPSGLEFVRVTPESIPFRLERLVTKRLPIRVRTTGQNTSGSEFEKPPTPLPSSVVAVGPISILGSMKFLETEDVDIDSSGVGDHVRTVPVRRIPNVELSGGDNIAVSFRVRWTPGQRLLSGLLVRIRGSEKASDLNAHLRPSEVAVSLAGPQRSLDKLDPLKVIPIVELPARNDRDDGSKRVEVQVLGIPDDITVASVVPKTVLVKIDVEPQVRRKSQNKP